MKVINDHRKDIKQIVPIVNRLFASFAGPIAKDIVPDVYATWSQTKEMRLATMMHYVSSLGNHLPDEITRSGFIRDAGAAILTFYQRRPNNK